MKRILLTLALVAGIAFEAAAQRTGSITATVVDAATGIGVPGAVMEFTPEKNPDNKKYTSTNAEGKVDVGGLPYGNYTLKVTFIGYDDLEQKIRIASAKTALGVLKMQEGTTRIDEVKIEVQSMRTSQKGDTVSYNASAFKVSNDSDVEGLLKKMPGITVNNGEVEAQGETVKKIFVDGKEFFGEDVTTAIKSLPAEAVKSIEVYNKLSDQAEFSGMDDGEGFKALNIITHENMRQGQFGKMYAGYGYDADSDNDSRHKYLAGGNVNFFTGDSRVSVLALFNNINQQNFSFEDILGVTGGGGGGFGRGMGQYMTRPQNGIAKVNSIGLNYSDSWGKKKNVTFEGSYFFNRTSTVNRSTTDRWYEDPYDVDTLSTRGYSTTLNNNHRFNARIEWKISPNQSLMSRTGFSFQSNNPLSTTNGSQWGESGYSRIDNYSTNKRHGYNVREFLQYRAKLGKDGRTITIDGNVNYGSNRNNADNWSNTAEAFHYLPDYNLDYAIDNAPLERLYQRSTSPSTNTYIGGNFTYTEPLSKYSQLSFQYRMGYQGQTQNKNTMTRYEDDTDYVPNPLLSSNSNSDYWTHNIGPGFRYSKERNTFVANVYYQHASLSGLIANNGKDERINRRYDNFTYFMMGNLNINRQNTIRLFVMSNTDNPRISYLQSIYDVSDAQYIARGNPNLNPSYSHSIRLHYTNSNVNKGRTFMWMFSYQNTSDFITNYTVQNPKGMVIDGEQYNPLQYSQRVNMDGYNSLRTFISYGMPLGFMKCNLNLSTGVSYSITPTMFANGVTVDADGNMPLGERNEARQFSYNAGAVLGSNISENVDFTVSWNGSYSLANNSLATRQANNRYFYHVASASLKASFLRGFTFTGSFSYTQNVGFTNDYNEEFMLCNLYLGHKLFKNKRGEVMVGVNDLFNQNQAFARSVGSGYTQNSTNSVVGRYYMVQFVYNLRHFGKKGSKNPSDYGLPEGGRGGFGGPGRMGPPMR